MPDKKSYPHKVAPTPMHRGSVPKSARSQDSLAPAWDQVFRGGSSRQRQGTGESAEWCANAPSEESRQEGVHEANRSAAPQRTRGRDGRMEWPTNSGRLSRTSASRSKVAAEERKTTTRLRRLVRSLPFYSTRKSRPTSLPPPCAETCGSTFQ